METELKFQIPTNCRAALERAVSGGEAQTTRLQAVYADTDGQHLARAGLALRLRKEGLTWVQTLKGRGDGLLNRLEHEVPLPAQSGMPTLDLQRHAGTPAGDRLAAVLPPGAVLLPLYRTDISRLHRHLRFEGAVIEVAYDRGWLLAGEGEGARKLAVNEIEFELLSGPPAKLAALALRWAGKHALWWDSRTKSECGMRLALGLKGGPAVTVQPPPRRPGDAALPAGHPALQAALTQAVANAADIADGLGGPDHLQALRAAVRRMAEALRRMADNADSVADDSPANLAEDGEAIARELAGPPGAMAAPFVLVGLPCQTLLLRTLGLLLRSA
jgi:inorganic triphosphatase YgiF